ncbi:MAG TPA: signal peptidase II [Candidatus Merdenecus merdavium]|nr:signal peptidase II [Candidatus Merdenecus merdavium]
MVYIFLPMILFAIDFIAKEYIEVTYKEHETKNICKDKIQIKKVYNKGAMLNVLDHRPEFVAGLSTGMVAVLIIGYIQLLAKQGYHLLKIALGLVIGGGLGNVFDRLKRKKVVDFFSFRVKNEKIKHTVFNLADIFVFLGGVIFIIYSILPSKKK